MPFPNPLPTCRKSLRISRSSLCLPTQADSTSASTSATTPFLHSTAIASACRRQVPSTTARSAAAASPTLASSFPYRRTTSSDGEIRDDWLPAQAVGCAGTPMDDDDTLGQILLCLPHRHHAASLTNRFLRGTCCCWFEAGPNVIARHRKIGCDTNKIGRRHF